VAGLGIMNQRDSHAASSAECQRQIKLLASTRLVTIA
jgi:hypothetical protein